MSMETFSPSHPTSFAVCCLLGALLVFTLQVVVLRGHPVKTADEEPLFFPGIKIMSSY